MARPSLLTRARHERIVELLRDGVPFATACRTVGVSPSAGYEWLYRGWGTHPDRPPAARYRAFAQDVDAVFLGGFAERHEDEFAESEFPEFPESDQGFVDAQSSDRAEPGFPQFFPQFPQSGDGFAEVTQPDEIRHEKRTRAREEGGDEEPRRAPMPWLSQRSRRTSILDIEF